MSKKRKLDPKVREAVCTRFGGFEKATDDQIMVIWGQLDDATKKEALANASQPKGDADAGSTGSK